MKVLVTGGSGSIGTHVVDALVANGHQVVVFDKVAGSGVETRLGDLRNPNDVGAALKGIDAVVHLAAIIPPRSEENVEFSQAVNVTGTSVLVEAMEQSPSCRRLVFASTATVHGTDASRSGPIKADDPVNPPNNYAKQKVQAEERIRASKLDWTILRVPAVPPIKTMRGKHKEGPLLLEIPTDAKIEVLHPDDAGLAFANAVTCDQAIGRTLMLGGGRANGCQLTGYEFASGITRAVGIGQLPRRVFRAGGAYAAAWVDTTDSEQLLRYQRHTFSQLTQQLRQGLGSMYYLALIFSPALRLALLLRSFAR